MDSRDLFMVKSILMKQRKTFLEYGVCAKRHSKSGDYKEA